MNYLVITWPRLLRFRKFELERKPKTCDHIFQEEPRVLMSFLNPRLSEEWGSGTGLGIFNLFFLSLVGPIYIYIYIYIHKEIKLKTYTYKATTVVVFIILCTYIRVPFTCSYYICMQNHKGCQGIFTIHGIL